MKLREKPPEAIRRDALKMATKKFSEGCTDCGMGYLGLAREHGASEEELAKAIDLLEKPVSRRHLFKIGAAGAVLALGRNLLDPTAAFATT